jgi:hypothetical protein
MTNFENIAINDATGTPRKVAGEFVVQGADTIFHQTAIALPQRLASGNIATLDNTGTTIPLSGMETHALFDFNNGITQVVAISARYFTGGRLYPVDVQHGIPQPLQTGGYEGSTNAGASIIPRDDESFSTGQGGSAIFFVPTRGAIELFIQTSVGTILDVDWALMVMPTTHPISTVTQIKRRDARRVWGSTTAQPYTDNDLLGAKQDALISDSYMNSTTATSAFRGAPLLTSLSYASGVTAGPVSLVAPDVDVFLFRPSEGPTIVDGAPFVMTHAQFSNLLAVLPFRQVPGVGQYLTVDTGAGWFGQALNLDIPLFALSDTGFGYARAFDVFIVYRGGPTLAINSVFNEGPGVSYNVELS